MVTSVTLTGTDSSSKVLQHMVYPSTKVHFLRIFSEGYAKHAGTKLELCALLLLFLEKEILFNKIPRYLLLVI